MASPASWRYSSGGRGERQGQVMTAARESELGKVADPLNHLPAPLPHQPPGHTRLSTPPGQRSRCHTSPHSCLGATAPELLWLLPRHSRAHPQVLPSYREDSAPGQARTGLFHQTGGLKARLRFSPPSSHTAQCGNLGLAGHRAPVQNAERELGWGV